MADIAQDGGAPQRISENWCEVRLSGKLPERRSNHCSFIVNDHLYIHGGRDIKEGPMSNMWRLSISGIKSFLHQADLMEESDFYGVSWEPVPFKGHSPGNISHHTAAVFGSQVVLFGGINEEPAAYLFDSEKSVWSKMKETGDVPKARDDHTLSQIDGDSFLIFGGFVEGSRVNESYIANKKGNTLEWRQVGDKAPLKPCVRASHSAVVYNGKCYIFGGQDDENNKLNDLWELDFAGDETFKQISPEGNDFAPSAKSGHTCNLHNGKAYVFGGIIELTKEVNEMVSLDLQTLKFQNLGEPGFDDSMNFNQRANQEIESPGLRKNLNASMKKTGQPISPNKIGGSPNKTMGKGAKLLNKTRRGKSPSKKDHEGKETKESGLASPTSVSMQNSFIIKNADESFDAYWVQMKKRKVTQLDSTMGSGAVNTMTGGSPSRKQDQNFGVVQGVQPAARDGHSTEVNEDGLMFVFGGDRHHMPFNDLYLMELN